MKTALRITEDKLAWLNSLVLAKGNHDEVQKQFCVMEAVAYVAGEKHSDHPKCASPVVTRFCIGLNDKMSDERRQLLKPYVVRLVGTRGTKATEKHRTFMLADWVVRECVPLRLDIRGKTEHADRLRGVAPIVDKKSAEAAKLVAREVRDELYRIYAAYAADAADAAYAAAYAAAAADAVADAAYAADAAARRRYPNPRNVTREQVQASTFGLLERLIAVTEK